VTVTEPVAGEAAGTTPGDAVDGGLRLPVPEEPQALGVRLRDAVLAGADLSATVGGAEGLGPWLWGRWQDQLEPAGMAEDAFLGVVDGYRREIWFWMLGDRRWEPLVAGLSGRLARRVPDPAS
jgi:hypothetical protein